MTLISGRNDVGKSAFLRVLRAGDPREWQPGGGRDTKIRLTWTFDPEVLTRFVELRDEGLADHSAAEYVRWALAQEGLPFSVQFAAREDSGPDIRLEDMEPQAIALGDAVATVAAGQWSSGAVPAPPGGPWLGDFVDAARRTAGALYYASPRRPASGRRSITYQSRLDSDAANLINVMESYRAQDYGGVHQALQRFIREAFPDITELGILPMDGTNEGELLVTYSDGRKVPLAQCGTGIEQMIALGVAVLTLPNPTLILLDEPSSYLHPAAEQVLIRFLRSHPKHQYVVATHSNVFLNAFPLSQARLLSKDATGATVVRTPDSAVDILEEVGLRAGDLWLSTGVIWTEGDTEAAIADVLRDSDVLGVISGVEVRPLPNVGKLSGRKAEASFRLVAAITDAVTALPIPMGFLFDRDEKDPTDIQDIERSSKGRAVFLEVREVENCFLDAGLIAERLRELTGTRQPLDETVEAALSDVLSRHTDTAIYPGEAPQDPLTEVRASKVLEILYEDLALSRYSKPDEGAALTTLAIKRGQTDLLAPFIQGLQQSWALATGAAAPRDVEAGAAGA